MDLERWSMELLELLDAERDSLRLLREAMAEHHEALRGQEPEAIGLALQRNLECVEASREANARRLAFTRERLGAGGLGEAGLEALQTICADAATAALGEKMEHISALGRDIRLLNDRNRQLAEHGLDLLRGDFRLLADLVGEAGAGRSPGDERGCLLSTRA